MFQTNLFEGHQVVRQPGLAFVDCGVRSLQQKRGLIHPSSNWHMKRGESYNGTRDVMASSGGVPESASCCCCSTIEFSGPLLLVLFFYLKGTQSGQLKSQSTRTTTTTTTTATLQTHSSGHLYGIQKQMTVIGHERVTHFTGRSLSPWDVACPFKDPKQTSFL